MPLGKLSTRTRMARDGAARFAVASRDNASATLRRLRFRLSRRATAGMPPVWTPKLTQFTLVSVFAVLFAAVFDPYFVPTPDPLPNVVLRFLREVTDAGKSGWYIVPAVILITLIGLANWRGIRHATRRSMMIVYGRAAFILVSLAVPGITVNLIKQVVGRARPYVADQFGVYAFEPLRFAHAFQSFPSGHAATAGSLAAILMIWYPRCRPPVFFAMAVLASARIPAGAHYPSDVVAGFSLAFIVALVIARWLARKRVVIAFRDGSQIPVLIGQ